MLHQWESTMRIMILLLFSITLLPSENTQRAEDRTLLSDVGHPARAAPHAIPPSSRRPTSLSPVRTRFNAEVRETKGRHGHSVCSRLIFPIKTFPFVVLFPPAGMVGAALPRRTYDSLAASSRGLARLLTGLSRERRARAGGSEVGSYL